MDVLADRLRDPGEALRLTGVVVFHHRRQKPSGQRAVRGVVHPARRLAHGVGRARRVGAVGETGEHCPERHVVAGLQVVSLGEGDPQPARAVLHPQQRDRVGEGLVVGHGEALDGVGEGVHAGARGHRRRQVDRERGVDQRDVGRDVGRAPHVELDLALGVGDHRPEGDLAPGPGGGRDRDKRWDAGMDGRLAPLVLHDAAAVHGDHPDALGGVDRAAAAQADQAVAPLPLVGAGALVDQGDGRVGPHLGEAHRIETGRAQGGERLVQQARLDDPLVGDQQRAAHAEGLHLLAERFDGSDGVHHPGR